MVHALCSECSQVRIFERWLQGARGITRYGIGDDTSVDPITAVGRTAHEILLANCLKIPPGNDNFPHFSSDAGEKSFGRVLRKELAACEDGDTGGDGLDIGNDVRGENHDALAGELREQIAKAHA